jgi:hypothetical protein
MYNTLTDQVANGFGYASTIHAVFKAWNPNGNGLVVLSNAYKILLFLKIIPDRPKFIAHLLGRM